MKKSFGDYEDSQCHTGYAFFPLAQRVGEWVEIVADCKTNTHVWIRKMDEREGNEDAYTGWRDEPLLLSRFLLESDKIMTLTKSQRVSIRKQPDDASPVLATVPVVSLNVLQNDAKRFPPTRALIGTQTQGAWIEAEWLSPTCYSERALYIDKRFFDYELDRLEYELEQLHYEPGQLERKRSAYSQGRARTEQKKALAEKRLRDAPKCPTGWVRWIDKNGKLLLGPSGVSWMAFVF